MDDKIKILIASVLKPADDVRSYSKIGQSLAQTNKYEVNIIGFDSKKKDETKNIFLYPIFKFKRNSIKRLFAPLYVIKKYLQLKPELIIVNTPELLWVIYLIKILFGTKIIYDIPENYQFNVKQNHIYRGVIKSITLLYLHVTEYLTKYFTEGFFVAEEIYVTQLKFIHKRPFIMLLNKSVIPHEEKFNSINFTSKQSLKFIYSGTIGEEYGTIEAIDFCKKLHSSNPNITLTIIGYSSDNQYLESIQNKINQIEFIQLITEDKPIPQAQIINEIKNSDIALLPYQLNPNISGRFPTKIYDYLALGIPMIIPPHTHWKAYLDQYHAGLCLNYINPDIEKFIRELPTVTFYKTYPKEEIRWKSQEQTMLTFVENIVSK
ncbi:hypothetical protein MATR_16840 [Marivirga tractuosa]|uniref:Glycosyl transferase group 1 n=1 Tax=Marivirga tractuosa (strain ATCC 23168 / DSM 4126 / NBRC 15989 / NCIMB 1408 / VKM B-1430 / H-43) TaxID=643867 RepID=E4TRF7_MARTH|nr:glycosyltransferase [Marivirga tractuosa]ADR20691.1 glycosyl transferase group 1 [Marivirga tractuosa DSM 4126]BDD14859.1 hypothetical protein MATR_16840 [Marivirga tractuosa]